MTGLCLHHSPWQPPGLLSVVHQFCWPAVLRQPPAWHSLSPACKMLHWQSITGIHTLHLCGLCDMILHCALIHITNESLSSNVMSKKVHYTKHNYLCVLMFLTCGCKCSKHMYVFIEYPNVHTELCAVWCGCTECVWIPLHSVLQLFDGGLRSCWGGQRLLEFLSSSAEFSFLFVHTALERVDSSLSVHILVFALLQLHWIDPSDQRVNSELSGQLRECVGLSQSLPWCFRPNIYYFKLL